MKILFAAGALFGLCLGAAVAQTSNPHAGHTMPAPAASPSTAGFQAANTRMHKAMEIEYSGDPDVDFARGMIPHHQGAIDMAKVELTHGKDPELRRMASEIISAQEKEIAFLKDWLKAKGR
jgi:uncharacterized protein (DUF305 family)